MWDAFHTDDYATPRRHHRLVYSSSSSERKRRAGLSCWLPIFCLSACPLFCPLWASLNPVNPHLSPDTGLSDLTFNHASLSSQTLHQPGCWTGTRRTRTAKRGICSEQVFKCLVLRDCGMAGPPSQLQHGARG